MAEKEKVLSEVAHPEYYQGAQFEVIDVIYDWGYGEEFAIGNAIKYLARAGKKDPDKKVQDLKKAAYYIMDLIERLEGEKDG